MKKLIFFTMAFVVVAFANIVNAQTLDDILNKHFQAVGQDKLMAAKSIYIKANVNQMGMDIPMEMKVKRPDKFSISMEAQGQKITQAFDGEKGWMFIPGLSSDPQELTGDMLKQAKQQPEMLIEGELYNYEKKGSTAEFAGKVNLDGKDVYRIKLTTSDGNSKDYFIDANTNYIVKVAAKVSSGGQSVDVEQNMSDFKTFDQITMATKIEQKTPMGNVVITMEDIKFNENFDDSIFEQPAK